MGAAILLRDVVGEQQHGLVVAVVPPQREVDLDPLLSTPHHDRRLQKRRFGLIEVADERLDTALVVHGLLVRLRGAEVAKHDGHARVQERQLSQPVLQRLAVEVDREKGAVVLRDPQRGQEGDGGASQGLARAGPAIAHRRLAGDPQ